MFQCEGCDPRVDGLHKHLLTAEKKEKKATVVKQDNLLLWLTGLSLNSKEQRELVRTHCQSCFHQKYNKLMKRAGRLCTSKLQ